MRDSPHTLGAIQQHVERGATRFAQGRRLGQRGSHPLRSRLSDSATEQLEQAVFPQVVQGTSPTGVVRFVLQLVLTAEERAWVRRMCREEHYLRQEVHARARPVAYLVLREEGAVLADGAFLAQQRERVGLVVFSRMQSSRCKGWYGNSQDVAHGEAKHTQWEMLVLSRCWLDPRIQRNGCWYLPKAASLVMKSSLQTIGYHYLLLRPPAFPERPFEIKEVISYCHSERFLCMVYWFARFKLVRENAQGLRTYRHALPPLTDGQRHTILDLSRLDKAAHQKRVALLSPTFQEVLFLTHRCAA